MTLFHKEQRDVFRGCIPALMTPCGADGAPDFGLLVHKAKWLMERGMAAVVYCGSMGEWPLLSAADRAAWRGGAGGGRRAGGGEVPVRPIPAKRQPTRRTPKKWARAASW